MRIPFIYAALALALAHAAPANEAIISAEKTPPASSTEKFMQSLSYADNEAVRKYCQAGGDVNICDPYTGMACLHFAARNNRHAAAQLLLDAGAKVNQRNKTGATALHLAAARGHADMAIMLLREGAEIDAHDRDGLTPLHLAAQHNHPEMVALLAGWGADLEARTNDRGLTPLHWAAFIGCPNTVKALMRCGANLGATDNLGRTPYDWANNSLRPGSAHILARRGGHWLGQ